MSIFSIASIAATVLTFLSFLGIVAWAYSRHRASAFAEAANAPFALPDDGGVIATSAQRTGVRS